MIVIEGPLRRAGAQGDAGEEMSEEVVVRMLDVASSYALIRLQTT